MADQAGVKKHLLPKPRVKQMTNRVLGAYIWDEAKGNLPEPKWPEGMAYDDLLNKAFAGRIIDSLDHEIVKRLRGLVQ